MTPPNLTITQHVLLALLWGFARFIAILPYGVKYSVLSPFIAFVLGRCIRYRHKVIDENLRNSFPDKSDQERAEIRRKYYHTLAEVIVDILDLSHLTTQKFHRGLEIVHQEQIRAETGNRDWIAMLAHYGCWEHAMHYTHKSPGHQTIGVYHPLTSPVMEAFFLRIRNTHSSTAVPMKEVIRFYMRHRESGLNGERMILGLIADQNPPLRPDSHWFRFLNQDSIFFDGAEKLALRFHLPVYFAWMRRIKPGCYQLTPELIYDGYEEVEANEITERYVRKLEQLIYEQPELWMWSHRRWKAKRPTA